LEGILFYAISAAIVGASVLFMTSKKMVHCIFYCFIVFIGVAGLFMLLDAPFLAAAQIFIYGGAVTVLILFIVMLTITDVHGILRYSQSGMGLLVIAFFGSVLTYAIVQTTWPLADKTIEAGEALMKEFASVLFKYFYFPFEIAGVLLLAALVGAIYLAREKE